MKQMFLAVSVCALVLRSAVPAVAQTEDEQVHQQSILAPALLETVPNAFVDKPFARFFPNLVSDFSGLLSKDAAITLSLGAVMSLAARPIDDHITATAAAGGADQVFTVGGALGRSYVQVGGALATYAIGRLTKHAATANVGSDLIRAQVLTGLLTRGLKLAVSRDRPIGTAGARSSASFPSGHASGTAASATVLWRHFGWKVGVPASLVTAFVAGARLQENQHYLSDIIFGASLGIASGRSVTVGRRGTKLHLAPTVVPGGAAMFVTVVRP